MITNIRKIFTTTVLASVTLLILMNTLPPQSSATGAAPAQADTGTLTIRQQSHPPTLVQAGDRLTYTIIVTHSENGNLHTTITNTLPLYVHTDEAMAGTTILPGGQLVWTPIIDAENGGWIHQVAVTVTAGYAGLLTNTLEVTSLEGPSAVSTHTLYAAPHIYHHNLPLVMRRYVPHKYINLLANPGFEGLGVPIDNDLPNYGNWTRDTFNGGLYGEIFTPEGWVTWWEEDEYKRPECKVIPNEPPFNTYPSRIYQGYYAGLCFTFYGKQHAGYYQVVRGLEPGATVTGWFYAHAWSCNEDEPVFSCGDPMAFSFQVGLDPDGNTDPFSDNILWSEPKYIYDTYRPTHPVTASVGETGQVTFFLRAHGKDQVKHNDAYWDNPVLIYTQP